jgi:hypothetical protein
VTAVENKGEEVVLKAEAKMAKYGIERRLLPGQHRKTSIPKDWDLKRLGSKL